jgi:hypothetical protein
MPCQHLARGSHQGMDAMSGEYDVNDEAREYTIQQAAN